MSDNIRTASLLAFVAIFAWLGAGGHFPFHDHDGAPCSLCTAVLAAVVIAVVLLAALERLFLTTAYVSAAEPAPVRCDRAAKPRAPPLG